MHRYLYASIRSSVHTCIQCHKRGCIRFSNTRALIYLHRASTTSLCEPCGFVVHFGISVFGGFSVRKSVAQPTVYSLCYLSVCTSLFARFRQLMICSPDSFAQKARFACILLARSWFHSRSFSLLSCGTFEWFICARPRMRHLGETEPCSLLPANSH